MIRRLDQRRIPGLSRLFGDFLYDYARASVFYPAGAPFDLDHLARQAAAIRYPEAQRQAVTAMLERQNAGWAPAGGAIPAATRELLRRLAEPGAVAIVTGQQVGLFGGPLLGLYKAMSAVLLAERLRARGTNAVPIFWMATQDHDLAEVDQAWALDAASQPQRISSEIAAAANASVGPLRLDAGISGVLEAWERVLGAAAPELRACYRPGATLSGAFGALFARWFAPWGLILFDPLQAPEAAPVWQPLFAAALERQPELARKLAERAAALEASGYHVQVEQTPAAAMLFLHRDGARWGLRRQQDRLLLGDEPMDEAEAREWIAARPEAVSPAALLRPLAQDLLFPTLAQITGPAETAYLAQSAVLYAALGVRQPVAYPRVSATLVDAKARRVLEKYGLELDQIWREPAAELLARQALPPGVEARLTGMRAQFDGEYDRLARELETLDPTLVDAARGAVQKIRHQLEQLETRVGRSFARRSQELSAQAQHLEGSLHPGRQLQERVLAAASFATRVPDLAGRLHEALEVEVADHQIVEV
ncbi:MAG: bacillithiol biosynthesis cysteine-adding enzyme BshC [Terriglobales bacterium]